MSDQSALPRILLVGATGYIGGTVLHHLITGPDALPSAHTVTLLVRGDDRANKLKQAYGDRVQPILFSSLDDTGPVEEIASQHDIVINAGTGFHPASAVAMVRGLAKGGRQDSKAGHQPWMIHTSGNSNICDAPLTGESHPDRWFTDADPVRVYEFEKAEDERRPYPQRTTELAVLDTDEELGVRAIALQLPDIIGEGSGLFNTSPGVTPLMMQYVLEKGHGFQLGDGTGHVGIVQIDDLADLYVLLVTRILAGRDADLPHGREGILFPCVGLVNWVDMSWGCVEAAFKRGVLPREGGPPTKEVRKIELDDFVAFMSGGLENPLMRHIAEIFAAHWNTVGTAAKKLGWKQTHGLEAMEDDYEAELTAALEGRRQPSLMSTTAQGK